MQKIKLIFSNKLNLFIELFIPNANLIKNLYQYSIFLQFVSSILLVLSIFTPVVTNTKNENIFIAITSVAFIVTLFNFINNKIYKTKYTMQDPKYFINFLLSILILVLVILYNNITNQQQLNQSHYFGDINNRILSSIGMVYIVVFGYILFNSLRNIEELLTVRKILTLLLIISYIISSISLLNGYNQHFQEYSLFLFAGGTLILLYLAKYTNIYIASTVVFLILLPLLVFSKNSEISINYILAATTILLSIIVTSIFIYVRHRTNIKQNVNIDKKLKETFNTAKTNIKFRVLELINKLQILDILKIKKVELAFILLIIIALFVYGIYRNSPSEFIQNTNLLISQIQEDINNLQINNNTLRNILFGNTNKSIQQNIPFFSNIYNLYGFFGIISILILYVTIFYYAIKLLKISFLHKKNRIINYLFLFSTLFVFIKSFVLNINIYEIGFLMTLFILCNLFNDENIITSIKT
ncbi:MAG: hypothetical protein NZZ41_05155, partial [Candidatus Dojkabacteria bacterium]|nr:hypothetical protein [Candidatus Dojkabacteria bacterium]